MTRPIAPGSVTPPILRQPVDLSQHDPAIVKAAQGMEAIFLDYMMQVMRRTVPKSEHSLQSPAGDIYQSLLDTEMAQGAARQGGIGLAEQIIEYLDSTHYNQRRGTGAYLREKSGKSRQPSQDD